jgi:hypothetical protein
MQERIRPPDTLGSPLEQVQRRRAALRERTAPVTLSRVPVVEDYDVTKELGWLTFRNAWTTAAAQDKDGGAYLNFANGKLCQRFKDLTRKDASDAQFAEGCALAAREFALGRVHFLSADEVAQRAVAETEQHE